MSSKIATTCLFWFGVAFTLVAPLMIGLYFHSPNTAWVAALCGAFVTFIARLEAIAEHSLGPVKGKMKAAIAEANATIDQLHEIATDFAAAVLTDMMAGNFMINMTLAKRLELYDKLMGQLSKLGVSDEQRRRAIAEWDKGVGLTYYRIIDHQLAPLFKKLPDIAVRKKIATDYNTLADFPSWHAPTPEQIERFCKQHDVLTPEIAEWIADYRHFRSTREIRRRDEFAKG